jgi:hypothetical protein
LIILICFIYGNKKKKNFDRIKKTVKKIKKNQRSVTILLNVILISHPYFYTMANNVYDIQYYTSSPDELQYYNNMLIDVVQDLNILFYMATDTHHAQIPQVKDNATQFDSIILYTVDHQPTTTLGKRRRSADDEAGSGCSTFECPICYDEQSMTKSVTPSCLHNVCNTCVLQHLTSFKTSGLTPTCSLCRAPYTMLKIMEEKAFNTIGEFIR